MTPDRSAGLAESARALAAGEVTSRALTEQALARIESTQATLNAFRIVRREAALAEADAADEQLAAGVRKPLLGVPVAVKDDMDVAGEPTAFGCRGEFPPVPEDGEAVRRLRAAGAVVVGKTNTCEFGQWPFTEGPAFGATRNPWNSLHTPGVRPVARRRRSPRGWSRRRSARTAPVRCASPPPGRTSSASSRSAAASRPGRAASPSTASPSTAPSPARSPTRPCSWTRRAATTPGTCTARPRSPSRRRWAATPAACASPSP